MRNNNSDFIQDSKQHSLHPYHLICMAAENFLFTINPTTLFTNTAQNHSFTFIWTLRLGLFFHLDSFLFGLFSWHPCVDSKIIQKSRVGWLTAFKTSTFKLTSTFFMVSGRPQPELRGGHQPQTHEGCGGMPLPPSSDGPFKTTDLRKLVQPQPEPRGQVQIQPQKSSSSQLSERSPYEMLDELFKFVQHKQQK